MDYRRRSGTRLRTVSVDQSTGWCGYQPDRIWRTGELYSLIIKKGKSPGITQDLFNWQRNVWEEARSHFQKNLDIIRLASKAGYAPVGDKLFMASEGTLQTLLLKTYEGNLLSSDTLDVLAQFASPLTLAISPGIDYKPLPNVSIFYSPASMRLIYVANDGIASLNVHGNEIDKNSFLQLGSNLKVGYNDKFIDERLTITSTMDLYSNYIEKPGNIDVLWTNDIGVILFDNFSINLVTELFYDDNVDVQIDLDDDGIYGEAAERCNGFQPFRTSSDQ